MVRNMLDIYSPMIGEETDIKQVTRLFI